MKFTNGLKVEKANILPEKLVLEFALSLSSN